MQVKCFEQLVDDLANCYTRLKLIFYHVNCLKIVVVNNASINIYLL